MIWLNGFEPEGRALYLDIYHVELRTVARESVFAVMGTLGDGHRESQVLVEVGRKIEITFVDEWLHCDALREFFGEVNREVAEKLLEEIALEMHFCIEDFPALEGAMRRKVVGYQVGGQWRPLQTQHLPAQPALPLGVAEASPCWMGAVA